MKTAKLFSRVFALLGALLLAGTAALSFLSRNAPVRLLASADGAAAQTEALMETLSQGDFASAGDLMYGQPRLDTDREFSSAFSAALWEAFTGSISYEFSGECYAADSGVSRDVTITALDISAMMPVLEERHQKLLKQQALSESDRSKIYDSDGSYQEAFVMDVLAEAAGQVLAENEFRTSWDITLNLVCQDGQWWILPDQALMKVLSGGMAD